MDNCCPQRAGTPQTHLFLLESVKSKVLNIIFSPFCNCCHEVIISHSSPQGFKDDCLMSLPQSLTTILSTLIYPANPNPLTCRLLCFLPSSLLFESLFIPLIIISYCGHTAPIFHLALTGVLILHINNKKHRGSTPGHSPGSGWVR